MYYTNVAITKYTSTAVKEYIEVYSEILNWSTNHTKHRSVPIGVIMSTNAA